MGTYTVKLAMNDGTQRKVVTLTLTAQDRWIAAKQAWNYVRDRLSSAWHVDVTITQEAR